MPKLAPVVLSGVFVVSCGLFLGALYTRSVVKSHVNPGGSPNPVSGDVDNWRGDKYWRQLQTYKRTSNGWDIQDHFGSVILSFVTLFKLMLFHENMNDIIRPFEDLHYIYNGLFWNLRVVWICVILLFGFVLLEDSHLLGSLRVANHH